MKQTIDLGYRPRPQFLPFHKRSRRFACIVSHRGAGKTVATVHDLLDAALRKEDSRFAYVAPYYSQAKAVAWDYLRKACAPLAALGAKTNESELRCDLPGGGQVRLHGADNYNSLRGLHLDGVALDEFADFDPRAWPEVIRPALSQKRGGAIFIGTPRGRNEFYRVWTEAQTDPDWFALMLKASETGLVTADEIESSRRAMSKEQFAQEYECSFDAAIVGSYYGELMAAAEQDKRIAGVPYEPTAQVWTAWDLGIRDETAIWFAQVVGREVHLIDYYEASGVDLGHYVREINNRPYIYGGHIVPHDAQAKELGTGKTRLEVLDSLGLRNITVCAMHRVEDGINAVRVMLPRCWFDERKCERGIEALKLYRSAFDEKLKTLRPHPVHDWTSHPADAMRYLAMSIDRQTSIGVFHRKIEYPKVALA